MADDGALSTNVPAQQPAGGGSRHDDEHHFKATFDHAPVGIAHIALDGSWLRINRGLREFLGYSEEDLRNRTFADITHPDDLDADLHHARRLRDGEIDSYTIEKRYLRADGTFVWASLSGSTIRHEDGTPRYFVAIVQDISKRKHAQAQAQQELETTNNLLASFASLSRDLDPHQVCESLADVVVALTGKSRVVVCLYEHGRRSFEVAAARNAITQPGMAISFDNIPAAYRAAVEEKATQVIDYESPSVSAEERAMAAPFNTLTALLVPILDEGTPVGLIAIDEPGVRSEYPPRQISIVETLAMQTATALHNARNYTREHHVARTLQAAMLALPETVEGIEFDALYRSASNSALVGGDFIDVFTVPSGKVCLVLGDVSGKGLQAASITAVVRSTIRAHALESDSPAYVLGKTNAVLCHFTEPTCFVTVFLGMLDPETRRLVYANGGHPRPLAIGPGGESRVLDGADPIVGCLSEATYEDHGYAFPDGWTALAYSDGVSEVRVNGEMFGDRRVLQALEALEDRSPHGLVDGLFASVTRFARGRFTDDITMLAFTPTGGAGTGAASGTTGPSA